MSQCILPLGLCVKVCRRYRNGAEVCNGYRNRDYHRCLSTMCQSHRLHLVEARNRACMLEVGTLVQVVGTAKVADTGT